MHLGGARQSTVRHGTPASITDERASDHCYSTTLSSVWGGWGERTQGWDLSFVDIPTHAAAQGMRDEKVLALLCQVPTHHHQEPCRLLNRILQSIQEKVAEVGPAGCSNSASRWAGVGWQHETGSPRPSAAVDLPIESRLTSNVTCSLRPSYSSTSQIVPKSPHPMARFVDTPYRRQSIHRVPPIPAGC